MSDDRIEINLTAGEAYSFATILQRNDLESPAYQVRVKAIGNSTLGSMYWAQWMAREALDVGVGESADRPRMTGMTVARLGGDLPELRANEAANRGWPLKPLASLAGAMPIKGGGVPQWVIWLYEANIRVCRALARDGGMDEARSWMPDFDPYQKQPAYARTAAVSPAIVTAGIVGAVAAVSLAVAWWARGREEARVGIQAGTIRQQAAVSAATRIALAYVAKGEAIPPALLESIAALGGGESMRAWAVPLAVAIPVAAVGGTAAWGLTHR